MAASLVSASDGGVAGAPPHEIVDLPVTPRSPRGHHGPETVTIRSREPVPT
jgi:hypothetical protein